MAMAACLLRQNPDPGVIGAMFGVSQSTVSRRWDVLRR
jgi:hypothetical protein